MEDIIIKYINNEATDDELAILNEALKSVEARKLLESYLHVDYMLNDEFQEFNSKNALDKFKKQTENVSLKISWRKKSINFLKYAAMIAIVISTAITIKYFSQEEIKPIDENVITLELNDGSIKIIDPNANQEIVNVKGSLVGKQNQDKLIYQNELTQNKETLSYNKLYVPYGKRFQIELSDGTLVYLNSGSTLKYPVRFIKGMPREVFLEGEAYFKVSKDKNDSFIVNTSDIKTEVYGTEFNVSSYSNDDKKFVVLVEGSIGVYSSEFRNAKQDLIMLTPNKKASYNNQSKKITTKDVAVDNYIVWKDGVLMFENERFENILRKLERHYNVSIQNNYTVLNEIKFTGTFDIESIEQVLDAFQGYRKFKYELTNDKIIINQ